LVEGFGGGKKRSNELIDIPPEARDAMQTSAVAALATRADPKWLPITRGRDPGLPKAAPVFDLDELRRRNAEALKQRMSKEHGD
jgi:hypothetical protein